MERNLTIDIKETEQHKATASMAVTKSLHTKCDIESTHTGGFAPCFSKSLITS